MIKTAWLEGSRLQSYGALNFVQFILDQPAYVMFLCGEDCYQSRSNEPRHTAETPIATHTSRSLFMLLGGRERTKGSIREKLFFFLVGALTRANLLCSHDAAPRRQISQTCHDMCACVCSFRERSLYIYIYTHSTQTRSLLRSLIGLTIVNSSVYYVSALLLSSAVLYVLHHNRFKVQTLGILFVLWRQCTCDRLQAVRGLPYLGDTWAMCPLNLHVDAARDQMVSRWLLWMRQVTDVGRDSCLLRGWLLH